MASKIALLGLLATAALAAPTIDVRSEQVHCDHGYYIEKWGCIPEHLSKRDDFDTTVSVGAEVWDDNVTELEGHEDNPHDELIGRYMELCDDKFCDDRKTITSNDGQLTLNLDGRFGDAALRDNFLELIKDALRKSLSRIEIPPSEIKYFYYKGPTTLNAQSGFGPASGFYLTMRMMKNDPEKPGCPDIVEKINAFGALVPELSPIFGLAGAVCSTIGSA